LRCSRRHGRLTARFGEVRRVTKAGAGERLVITGATAVTMTGPSGIIPDSEVVVEGSFIVSVGPRGQGAAAREPGTRVIDATGKVLIPGLVNAHTHAAMSLLRGYAEDLPLQEWLREKIWPAEEQLTPEDVYWGTLLAIAEMILSGTTAFADMYFHMDEVASAVRESGARAALAPGMVSGGGGDDELLGAARRFAARWHGAGDGRITVMFGPHAPYTCTPGLLGRVSQLAREMGLPVHIHLAETEGEVAECLVRYGRTPLGVVREAGLLDGILLAAHCVHLEDDEVAALASLRGACVHCPVSNLKLGAGIAPLLRLLDAGVPVALGTDGAASAGALDMFTAMRAAALLPRGIHGDPTRPTAYQVLEMATVGGARAIGQGHHLGKLQPGMKADLVILDMRRPGTWPVHDLYAGIVYSAGPANVETVIVDGRPVLFERRLLNIDLPSVMAECEARARRLVAAGRTRRRCSHFA